MTIDVYQYFYLYTSMSSIEFKIYRWKNALSLNDNRHLSVFLSLSMPWIENCLADFSRSNVSFYSFLLYLIDTCFVIRPIPNSWGGGMCEREKFLNSKNLNLNISPPPPLQGQNLDLLQCKRGPFTPPPLLLSILGEGVDIYIYIYILT